MADEAARAKPTDPILHGAHADRAGHAGEAGQPRPPRDRQPGPEPDEDPASGTIDHPIAPGEAQAGDASEQAANRGGPVDVFPLRQRQRKDGPAS